MPKSSGPWHDGIANPLPNYINWFSRANISMLLKTERNRLEILFKVAINFFRPFPSYSKVDQWLKLLWYKSWSHCGKIGIKGRRTHHFPFFDLSPHLLPTSTSLFPPFQSLEDYLKGYLILLWSLYQSVPMAPKKVTGAAAASKAKKPSAGDSHQSTKGTISFLAARSNWSRYLANCFVNITDSCLQKWSKKLSSL